MIRSTLRKPVRSFIFLGIALLVANPAIFVTPHLSDAQGQIYLEDAVQSGLVESLITGSSIRFTEPMLNLQLRSKSTTHLTIVVRAGLELVSENPDYADVVIGKESIASLQTGEERGFELYAFSLDPTRSFPPAEGRYSIRGMSGNPEMLDLLARVREQHAEGKLTAQLAVWILAMDYTFEQLEDILEVSLESYQTETLSLLGLPTAGPDSTEEAVTPPSGPADGTVSGSAEPSATPLAPMPKLQPTSIALIIGAMVLAIVLIVVVILTHTQRRPKQSTEPSRPGKPTPIKEEEHQQPEQKLELPPSVGKSEAQLVVFDEVRVQQAHDLPAEGGVLLSRAKLPFVVIPMPAVSAPHALLSRKGHSLHLKDLNSSNGTRVNGQKLLTSQDAAPETIEVPLKAGTRIAFGNAVLAFEQDPPLLRDGQGKIYEIPAAERVIVTRLELPHIIIGDNTVSAPHALLRREGRRYMVKDLNSGNGTQLGTSTVGGFDYGVVSKPTVLQESSRLRLGRVELEMRPSSDSSDKGAVYIGPYRIMGPIGRGGMARVYEGQDRQGQPVAIKVPKEDYAYDEMFRQRFAREARIWSSLDHNSIVPILKFGEDKREEYLEKNKGLLYIAMDYVDGCSLTRLLLAAAPLEERIIMEIIRCVAGALQIAHDQGVVHRDIKPSNILISSKGQVFITDFGIARAAGEATITRPGEVPGAPLYISPEQAAGQEGDQRSDIYSLGVVIYQMITGQVPFDGTELGVVLEKHRTEAPLAPDEIRGDVSKPLMEIVMRCLEKEPDKRYQSAQEIVDKLPLHKSAEPELAALVAEAEKYTISIDL